MAAGWGNPKDNANATSSRPSHVNTAAGVRRWYQNGLVPDAQDFNAIIAAMREVQDGAGIADAEGDDTLLLQAIQALTMPKLSGNTTFYVRSDGSDSNDGSANTAGAAWLTIQKAINVLGGYNLNGYTATVQVADGTYTGAVSVTRPFVNGLVVLVGNTTTPANCHLNVAGSCLSITRAQFEVKGFKLTASAGSCLAVVSGLVDITGLMEYGSATGSHISAVRQSAISIYANYTISGGAAQHYNIANNSVVNFTTAATITLSGTPAFSVAFCLLTNACRLSLSTYLTTFSGAATGIKYIIESNCEINTTSGTDPNDQLPGSIAGVAKPRFDGAPALLNLLMNGSGRLQDGPSGACADDAYGLHNRWYALTQTGALTPSSLSNVADGIPSMIRLTNTLGSAQRIGYAQIIEGINCRHLRGRQVTFSTKVRRSDGGNVRLAILEWTGTEDTVTSEVVNNWTSSTYTAGNFFASTTLTVAGVTSVSTVAATLKDIALTVTVSSSCNNLIVFVWTESTITATTGTFDIIAQLLEGGAAARHEHRPIQIERLLSSYGNPINVKNFGATGNGVTDDATAIQAAIDHALNNSVGGTVYFPAGKYYCATGLQIDVSALSSLTAGARINFRGDGSANTYLIFPTTTNLVGLTVDGATTWGAGTQMRFSMEGIYMLGGTADTANNQTGLLMDSATKNSFRDVVWCQWQRACDFTDVLLTKFSSCLWTFNTQGLYAVAGAGLGSNAGSPFNEIVFDGCHFTNNRHYGLYVVQSNNLTFTGGSFESNGRQGAWTEETDRWALRVENGGYNGAATLNLYGTHFETNAGKCEIWIDHRTNPGVYNITGCDFVRNGLDTGYGDEHTTYNIYFNGHASTTSADPAFVNVKESSFQTVNSASVSASEPTIYQEGTTTWAKWSCEDNFHESTTNLPAYPILLRNEFDDRLYSKARLFDDFFSYNLDNIWSTRVGSNGSCVALRPVGGTNGLGRLTTGADAGGSVALNGSLAQLNTMAYPSGGKVVLEFSFRLLTDVTSVALFIGLTDQVAVLEIPVYSAASADTITSDATNAVGIMFDTSMATDNIWCVGVKDDVDATKIDSTYAPVANTFQKWRIEVDTSGNAKFYRNKALIGSMSNAVSPTTAFLAPVIVAFSRTNSSRNIDLDYIMIETDRS